MEDLYSRKLAWLKDNERPEAVLLVAYDPERINLAMAWTNLEAKRLRNCVGALSERAGMSLWQYISSRMASTSTTECVINSMTALSAPTTP